jgi:hypothetical protein
MYVFAIVCMHVCIPLFTSLIKVSVVFLGGVGLSPFGPGQSCTVTLLLNIVCCRGSYGDSRLLLPCATFVP